MKCPSCGLINPDTAQQCDCGYDFQKKAKVITNIIKKTIKNFIPNVLQEDISEALNAAKDFEYPEHLRTELSKARKTLLLKTVGISILMLVGGPILAYIGWMDTVGKKVIPGPGIAYLLGGIVLPFIGLIFLIRGFIRTFTGPRQNTPEQATKTFYSELVSDRFFPNYGKAYLILAPSIMRKTKYSTLSKFTEIWKNIESVLTMAIFDKVTCSLCSKEGSGLWTPEPCRWEDRWRRYSKEFIHCPKCGAIYCASCLGKLEKYHHCHNCKTRLEGASFHIMMSEPKINLTLIDGYVSVVEKEQERLVRVVWEAKSSATYLPPWSNADEHETTKYRNLGEQGNQIFRFYNTAVNISGKWYLLAGEPGTISSD